MSEIKNYRVSFQVNVQLGGTEVKIDEYGQLDNEYGVYLVRLDIPAKNGKDATIFLQKFLQEQLDQLISPIY